MATHDLNTLVEEIALVDDYETAMHFEHAMPDVFRARLRTPETEVEHADRVWQEVRTGTWGDDECH